MFISSFAPLKCEFRGNTSNVTLLEHIVQRKGEAEMALLDWLISAQDDIKVEAVVSVVTSRGVEAVYTHVFVASKYKPRNSNRRFKNQMFIILQMPRSIIDINNVTTRGSYMSAHVLLNLLNELGKGDKMRGLPTIYLFFATSLINSIIQEHEC